MSKLEYEPDLCIGIILAIFHSAGNALVVSNEILIRCVGEADNTEAVSFNMQARMRFSLLVYPLYVLIDFSSLFTYKLDTLRSQIDLRQTRSECERSKRFNAN